MLGLQYLRRFVGLWGGVPGVRWCDRSDSAVLADTEHGLVAAPNGARIGAHRRGAIIHWRGIGQVLCMDICIDGCIGICMDMCIDMYVDMCIDMRVDMCVDMCIDMCTDLHVDTGIDMWKDMYIDLYIDICTWTCV